MSLVEFQRALLSLYTNELFLNSFISNREKALASFILTNREKEALDKLALKRIETFSKELRYKRIRVARKIFKKIGSEKTPVFLFPTHYRGPALFFLHKNADTEVSISKGMLALFSEVIKKHTILSYSSIVLAISSLLVSAKNGAVIDEPTLSDLIRAVRIIRIYRLNGKPIRKTL